MRSLLALVCLVPVLLVGLLVPAMVLADGHRGSEPLLLTGDSFPAFDGVSLDQLYVYAHDGAAWGQIPWQFDEYDGDLIVPAEDGLLDADDLLVFMAGDIGRRATASEWLDDADSRQYPRYELTVSDPTTGMIMGHVYVYRSTTLTRAVSNDYADFLPAQWRFDAEDYRLDMLQGKLGAANLEMHGLGVDILDRTKVRVKPKDISLITEDNTELEPYTVFSDGPVRAVAGLCEGTTQVMTYAYGAMFQNKVIIDVTYLGVDLEWARVSADLTPTVSGTIY